MNPNVEVDAVAPLRAAFESGTSVYALVDPMLGEPVSLAASDPNDAASLQAAREGAWESEVQTIELDPRVPLAPALHPYLVTLGGRDDDWLATTFEMAQAERAAAQQGGVMGDGVASHRIAWLQSSRFAHDLAEVLAPLLRLNAEAHIQAHVKARYLRLADRRVLDWTRQVVGDERLTAAMGCIRRWVYLGVRGNIVSLHNPSEGEHGEPPAPLCLNWAEWKQLMQGEALHPTLARWLGEAGPHAPGMAVTDAELYRRAAQALARADQAATRWPARFVSAHDRNAWAALSLLHPGFEERRVVATLLDAAEEPDAPVETLHTLSGALHAALSEGTAA